jgi:hypothetical protein
MNDFDHLREQAMWDFQAEHPAPPTAGVVGIVACVAAFLGLALAVEL